MPFASKPVVKLSQVVSSVSKDELRQIYANSETDFIVSMSKAILNWQGFKGDLTSVARIHGKRDPFISCPADCEIIRKGGHMIAISHADECVNFVEKH
jgi:hypothetical protein